MQGAELPWEVLIERIITLGNGIEALSRHRDEVGANRDIVTLGRMQAELVRQALRIDDAESLAAELDRSVDWMLQLAAMRPDANPEAN